MSSEAVLREYESHLEAFESQLAIGAASTFNLREYLPTNSDAAKAPLLVEMLRILLEHEWSRGDRRSIERFRDDYPEVFARPDVLAPLAFEEYRLRIQAGESVTPDDFSGRFGVDVAAWPELEPEEQRWRSFSQSAPDAARRLERARRELPEAGEQFDDFTLLSELGRGAFARVFLARQESLSGRLVALKVTAGPTVEPRRMARLQHGNIMPIYSLHTHDQLTGVCMPFLGCATLADVVRGAWQTGRPRTESPLSGRSILSTIAARRSVVSTLQTLTTAVVEPLPENPSARLLDQIESDSYVEAVVRLVARVAEGLAHAHVRGILHRDLKPANILLADDGEPLILDFNLAEETGPTASGVALVGGTLPYMSPEQLEALVAKRRDAQPVVDARSDLFSLGVVLYELLTGRLPRNLIRGTVDQVAIALRRAWDEPLVAASEQNLAVTPGLASIVDKCLSVDPTRRYATAGELAEDLERHLAHRPLRYAAERSWRERFAKWSRRHPRLTSATGVTVLAAGLLTIVGAAWVARGVQLERAAATTQMRAFEDELPSARVLLVPGVHQSEPELARRGAEQARKLLDTYAVSTDARWQERPQVERLNPAARERLSRELGELAGLLAVVESQGDAAPNDSSLVTALGLCRERKYDEAARILSSTVERDPRDAAAWLALGYCHVRLNDLSQAEIDYSMCQGLAPSLYVPVYFRGLARLEQKRHAAAWDDLSRAIELAPQLAEAHFHRGLAAQALRRHDDAIRDFTRSLELGLRHTRTYFLRARSYAAIGDTAAATKDRERGMSDEPTDSLSYVARALERIGRDAAGARADLEKALELDPTSAVARANLAHVLSERLGEKEAALECLDRWIETYPKDALAWGSRAVLEAREGKAEEAVRDVEEALRWSQAPFTRYQTACALALVSKGEAARADRARKLIAQALEEEPQLALDMRHDADLVALRGDMRFTRLIGAALVLVEDAKVEHGQ